jgi:hypothetical protein
MRRSLCLALLVFPVAASAQGYPSGSLAGRVTDAATGETLLFIATVTVLEGTSLRATTDDEGDYRIIGIPVGVHAVVVRAFGYEAETVEGVQVDVGHTTRQDFALTAVPPVYEPCYHAYWRPLLSTDPFASRKVWRAGLCSGEIDFTDLPVER